MSKGESPLGFNSRIAINYGVLVFFLILLFQNCSERFGYIELNSQNKILLSESGNGGGYDGKLSFLIHYKDESFYTNKFSLLSGEKIYFEILGGQAPYSYQLQGVGQLENSSQSYIAPFLQTSPAFENILITDSQGLTGKIEIEVKSFISSLKLQFPAPGSLSSNTRAQSLSTRSNGTIFSLNVSHDFQDQSHSILRSSTDLGNSWTTIKKFNDFYGQLFINSFNDQLFITSHDLKLFYHQTSENSDWNEIKTTLPLSPSTQTPIQFFLNKIEFLNHQTLLAVGYSLAVQNREKLHTALVSRDNGVHWDISYIELKNQFYSRFVPIAGEIEDTLIEQSKIYISGFYDSYDSFPKKLFLKSSQDLGLTWTDEIIKVNNPDQIKFNSTGHFQRDSLGNLYFLGKFTNLLGANPLWCLLKKTGNEWNEIYRSTNLQGNILSHFIVNKKNEFIVLGKGFVNISDDQYSVDTRSISQDLGKTWETTSTRENESLRRTNENFILLNDGSLLTQGAKINGDAVSKAVVYKSYDLNEWSIVDEFQDMSVLGGNFKASDFLTIDNKNFFMVGEAISPYYSSIKTWLTLKSSDGGLTWTPSDHLSDLIMKIGEYSFGSKAISIAKNSKNEIYVAGQYKNYAGIPMWHIRKSSDLGNSWSNISNIQSKALLGKFFDELSSIYISNDDEIFITGIDSNPITKEYSTILKRSQDGGNTWIDLFQSTLGKNPFILKNCGDFLFLITNGTLNTVDFNSYDTDTYYELHSYNRNLNQWSKTQLPPISGYKLTNDAQCSDKNQIQLLSYETPNPNPSENIIKVQLHEFIGFSSDNPLGNWNSKLIEHPFPNFIPNSFMTDNTLRWMGGYLQEYDDQLKVFKSKWVVIGKSKRTNDFYIADHLESENTNINSSSVKRIKPCLNGLCVIGLHNEFKKSNTNPFLLDSYSLFKYVELP